MHLQRQRKTGFVWGALRQSLYMDVADIDAKKSSGHRIENGEGFCYGNYDRRIHLNRIQIGNSPPLTGNKYVHKVSSVMKPYMLSYWFYDNNHFEIQV